MDSNQSDREIQQNLENIEKYLMIANMENEKMKKSGKPSSTKLRGFLQNISKECLEARRLSLTKAKTIRLTTKTPKTKKHEEIIQKVEDILIEPSKTTQESPQPLNFQNVTKEYLEVTKPVLRAPMAPRKYKKRVVNAKL